MQKQNPILTETITQIQILLAGTVVYSIAMNFAKIALFLLYYRIFASSRAATIAICLGILLCSCYYISAAIVLLVLCVPRSHDSWISPRSIARCRPTTRLGIPGGVFNLVSDLYIFVLPLPLLLKLQMPLRRKIGITALFLTGLM